jgi:hypothetical protein
MVTTTLANETRQLDVSLMVGGLPLDIRVLHRRTRCSMAPESNHCSGPWDLSGVGQSFAIVVGSGKTCRRIDPPIIVKESVPSNHEELMNFTRVHLASCEHCPPLL